MVIHMNRKIRGWCAYHRHHNAKACFSRIDHELWTILWYWAKRTYPKKGRRRLVDELFNGGRPWKFLIRSTSTGKPLELIKAAETPIVRHIPVQSERSFYDGDWAYWGKRLGRYPGLPTGVGHHLKSQNGRCRICKEPITKANRVLTAIIAEEDNTGKVIRRCRLLHEHCSTKLSIDTVTKNPFYAV